MSEKIHKTITSVSVWAAATGSTDVLMYSSTIYCSTVQLSNCLFHLFGKRACLPIPIFFSDVHDAILLLLIQEIYIFIGLMP
jgi:hypothetical protein